MTFQVHIGDHAYAVVDDDLADVKAQILAAVHSGGGFVDLRLSSGHPVGVLVTPASAVSFERLPPPVEPSTVDEDADTSDFAFFFDLDL